jgi:hypothetical protein
MQDDQARLLQASRQKLETAARRDQPTWDQLAVAVADGNFIPPSL